MDYSWEILSTYFRDQGLAEMQITSFNEFIVNGIQSVINSEPMIKSTGSGKEHIILLGDVFIDSPSIIGKNRNVKYITPQKARQKGIHYASSVCVNLVEIIKEQDETVRSEHFRIPICKIPIMLKSCKCNLSKVNQEELPGMGECENDPGGYFVVNGLERVIVTQKRMNYNQVLVYKNEENKANKIKYRYYTETRSMSEETCHSVELRCIFGNDEKSIKFILPNITIRVPVGIVLKAMGFTKHDILKMINLSKFPSIQKYLLYIEVDGKYITNKKTGDTELVIKTQKDAIMYLSNFISPKYYQRFIKEATFEGNKKESWKKCKCIEKILSIEILPHLGIKQSFTEQGIYLTYIIRKLLLTVVGMRQTDNKDNIMNKRYQSTGILFTELFRSLYKKWIIDIREQLDKKGQDVIAAISKNNKMTENIKKCMLTEWGVKGNNWSMSGVSQIRASKNFADMISHLTRCVIPISKKGKNTDIRQINASQFFYECLAETPEGQSVGIVTNLTPLTNVTGRIDTFLVREIIKELIIGIEEYSSIKSRVKQEKEKGNEIADECEGKLIEQDLISCPFVFLNGDLLGFTDDPLQFVETVKHWRKIGYLHYTISIVYDRIDGEIRIFSDEGRLIRPLLTVKNGRMEYPFLQGKRGTPQKRGEKESFTWDQLIENGYISYIDPSEIETAQIVMNARDITKSTEYCEINPVLMWGLTANMVPFGNYSPSPRMSYVVSMIKQALGMPNLAYKNRADTISYVLDYPQSPITQTKMGQITGYYDMPTGTNAIVAVATYKGMNTEDSIILNGSSLDRGLFSATIFKTYFTEERRIDNYSNEIIKLPSTKIRNHFNYDFLDERGIVKIGSCVEVNDVIIGKVLYKSKEDLEIDISVAIKVGETGIVDRVFVERNPDGYRVVNVVIRKHLVPVIGDKFCTHKQKGTVGHIARQEDLPFSMATGMVPDVIINPHAFTSRMTVNVPLEMISGKIGAIKGEVMDGTSFNQPRNLIDKLTDDLGALGYQKQGFETMINGETGEMLHAQIYMGISQYYRLKHLVEEKMHCLTLDHEVLTNRGWLNVRDIRPNDLVGILGESGELIYSPSEAILIYPAIKRKMYIIETEDISLYTTRNHKMYVKKPKSEKYELIEADNLYSTPVRYKSNIKWDSPPFKYDNIDDLFITDNFLILTAIYIMHGKNIHENTENGGPDQIAIDPSIMGNYIEISLPNPFIKSLTIGSLNNLKIFCYTWITENIIRLSRFNKDLIHAKKSFNKLVSQLDAGQCRILLKIFFHLGREVVFEKTLADSIQILCLHAGYNCRYSFLDNPIGSMGKKDPTEKKVKITLMKNKKDPNTKYSHIITEKRIIDTVPVFCLTVKGGVFYVRRNGKSVFTGNSRKSGHLNALTRQPVAGRQRAGGLKFGNMETECAISHSASAFLKERLFSTSDPFQIKICNDCGCDTILENECISCKGNNIKMVVIPFPTKLLHHLLKVMCLRVKPEVI